MLRNCGNIITAIQQRPQKQIILDVTKTLMASSSANIPMEKAAINPDPLQHPLKCPRCDSSNTKFCYYNNYSLSQPRHFCKACKRYWTRGGTLRNVPVGGGCRKNKRTKRPGGDAATSTVHVQRRIDLPTLSPPPPSNRIHNNPLSSFYAPVELNFPFSNFRVSNSDNSGFDLHSQMNGFSSGLADHAMTNGFKNGYKPLQDVASFSGNHNSIFFGSSSTSTMASLLASCSLQHPYEDPGKDVKVEGDQNRGVWNPTPNPVHDQIIINSSDPASTLLWNNNTWFDPSNMGSSVPSLI